jgi:hypothetical protein
MQSFVFKKGKYFAETPGDPSGRLAKCSLQKPAGYSRKLMPGGDAYPRDSTTKPFSELIPHEGQEKEQVRETGRIPGAVHRSRQGHGYR